MRALNLSLRCVQLFSGLNHYRRPVRQDLSDALHDLSGIVTRTDDGVGSQLRRVLRHPGRSRHFKRRKNGK